MTDTAPAPDPVWYPGSEACLKQEDSYVPSHPACTPDVPTPPELIAPPDITPSPAPDLAMSGWAITIDLGIVTLIAAFAVIVGLTVVWWIRHRNKV